MRLYRGTETDALISSIQRVDGNKEVLPGQRYRGWSFRTEDSLRQFVSISRCKFDTDSNKNTKRCIRGFPMVMFSS